MLGARIGGGSGGRGATGAATGRCAAPGRLILGALAGALVGALLGGCPAADEGAPDGGGADQSVEDRDLSGGGDSDLRGGADLTGVAGTGDCASNADCPGGRCVELTPGGYRVCATPPIEATRCTGFPGEQCCTSADCDSGRCYASPLVPVCSGILPQPRNVCGADQCGMDAACPANAPVCVPAGALGYKVRACMAASCLLDADCKAAPGGRCAPVANPCCSASLGLYCRYPNEGCRSNADCARGYCDVEGGRSRCFPGAPRCPVAH